MYEENRVSSVLLLLEREEILNEKQIVVKQKIEDKQKSFSNASQQYNLILTTGLALAGLEKTNIVITAALNLPSQYFSKVVVHVPTECEQDAIDTIKGWKQKIQDFNTQINEIEKEKIPEIEEDARIEQDKLSFKNVYNEEQRKKFIEKIQEKHDERDLLREKVKDIKNKIKKHKEEKTQVERDFFNTFKNC